MKGRAAAPGIALLLAAAAFAGAGWIAMPAPEARSFDAGGAGAAAPYLGGAPPGFSGGFGEQSCDACHFSAQINAGPGRVELDGVPSRFTAGERYPLTITLSRPGLQLGGFQLTARFADGGAQAGALGPAEGEEERVRVERLGSALYASQREGGTAPTAADTARWSVVWTAPAEGAGVVFHVAANAADGDGTAEHDYVHTLAIESAPAAAP